MTSASWSPIFWASSARAIISAGARSIRTSCRCSSAITGRATCANCATWSNAWRSSRTAIASRRNRPRSRSATRRRRAPEMDFRESETPPSAIAFARRSTGRAGMSPPRHGSWGPSHPACTREFARSTSSGLRGPQLFLRPGAEIIPEHRGQPADASGPSYANQYLERLVDHHGRERHRQPHDHRFQGKAEPGANEQPHHVPFVVAPPSVGRGQRGFPEDAGERHPEQRQADGLPVDEPLGRPEQKNARKERCGDEKSEVSRKALVVLVRSELLIQPRRRDERDGNRERLEKEHARHERRQTEPILAGRDLVVRNVVQLQPV